MYILPKFFFCPSITYKRFQMLNSFTQYIYKLIAACSTDMIMEYVRNKKK